MKSYIKYPLLIIVLMMVSLLFISYLVRSANEKKISQNQEVSRMSSGLPVSLRIPIINVNAKIQSVGVTLKGAMEVPNNATDVGWLNLGPRPGDIGSAVIDGHFDGENGEPGIFFNLYKLKKGDKLYIQNDKGKSITFIVQGSRIYDPGYADNVFISSDGAHLNLITCDGVWDGVKKSYSKRLVIFTDITH